LALPGHAVRFLTELAGVDPRRLGAVGYGEFRPVADNATPEGRARNRCIAITILSEELAGADTAPAATPQTPAVPSGSATVTNTLAVPPARALLREVALSQKAAAPTALPKYFSQKYFLHCRAGRL
jgi:hypothetical protein